MTNQQPIYVNQNLFLGRVEEQKQFRHVLQEMLTPPPGETLPYVLLLYGQGGMGKTTLAQRFRDIATLEPPFEGSFQTVWIDWEEKQRKLPALQVGRQLISPETVYDIIHDALIQTNNQWGRYFRRYQKLLKERSTVEKKAAEILTGGDQDELTQTLRGATTTLLAKAIRMKVPIGDTGEQVARAFLDAGVEVTAAGAAALRQQIENRLQARLKPEQYQLYLAPHTQLANALAEGLRQIAARKPLILFLDTYEIVDRTDPWLRDVIKAAGARLVWVISGRHNLEKSGQFGNGYFRGYSEDFPRRLLAYDMRQLALDDVRAYLADIAPNRPADEDSVTAILRATRGIPLALYMAGELWARGVPAADIAGDVDAAVPHQEIVNRMTARYLLHTKDQADRHALYALALAGGEIDILHAMLQPEDATAPFDLLPLLARLRREYAAVHREEARLHDEAAAFIAARLRQQEYRTSPPIRQMIERAADAWRARLARLEAELPLLEERAVDDEWVQAALALTRVLFWLDEHRGWQWLVPRFVEGLAYSRDLRQGLLDVAAGWQDQLSRRGRQRLKKWQAVGSQADIEAEAEMLAELERLARLGWLAGDAEAERRAVLHWRRGQWHYRRKQYTEAARDYERAEADLPEEGERLRQQLGEAMDELAGALMWPEGQDSAVYAAEAEQFLPKVVQWLPEKQNAWYRLGVIHSLAKRHEEAIAAYEQAIALDPKYAAPHNGLGYMYSALGRHEEAIAAYEQAIALDPKDAYPHNGLGNMYSALGRHEEAVAAYEQAIALDPQDATPHNGLGTVYRDLGRHEEAIVAYQQAIALDPQNATSHASLAACYRKLGQEAEYQTQVHKTQQLIVGESEYNRACFAAICGQVDEALALLEAALAKRQVSLEWARRDPDFDFIRDDPRFQALVG